MKLYCTLKKLIQQTLFFARLAVLMELGVPLFWHFSVDIQFKCEWKTCEMYRHYLVWTLSGRVLQKERESMRNECMEQRLGRGRADFPLPLGSCGPVLAVGIGHHLIAAFYINHMLLLTPTLRPF